MSETLTVKKETKTTKITGRCTFPNCNSAEDREGYCIGHAKLFAGPKEKPAPKPIAKESPKRAKENRKYRKEVGKDLEADPRCHINSPVCTGVAEGMNHKQKRSPKNISKKSNQEHSCNACNNYVEANPLWAKENGHQVSRFAKDIDAEFLTEEQIEALPEEIYVEGNVKTFEVVINNNKLSPEKSLSVRRHSETFMWGNPSVGSLQLSLAILLEYLPAEQSLWLYKKFEKKVVCTWRFSSFEETVDLKEIIKQLISLK